MKIEKTERGFSIYNFIDDYGVECSLQKSSSAEADKIWFGCNRPNVRKFVPGEGWVKIPEPDGEWIADTRMHLTVDQVKTLLPMLIAFVETGEIDVQPNGPIYE